MDSIHIPWTSCTFPFYYCHFENIRVQYNIYHAHKKNPSLVRLHETQVNTTCRIESQLHWFSTALPMAAQQQDNNIQSLPKSSWAHSSLFGYAGSATPIASASFYCLILNFIPHSQVFEICKWLDCCWTYRKGPEMGPNYFCMYLLGSLLIHTPQLRHTCCY